MSRNTSKIQSRKQGTIGRFKWKGDDTDLNDEISETDQGTSSNGEEHEGDADNGHTIVGAETFEAWLARAPGALQELQVIQRLAESNKYTTYTLKLEFKVPAGFIDLSQLFKKPEDNTTAKDKPQEKKRKR